MQERFEIEDHEEFLEPSDFSTGLVDKDEVIHINGHPLGDMERSSIELGEDADKCITKESYQKKPIELFEGLHLNQLVIVKSGIYIISGSSENFRAGFLDNNAVVAKYFDSKTGKQKKAKNGFLAYRLLTQANYHFESRKTSKVMKLHFNPDEIVLLPREFDTLKVSGDQKRREIEKIITGVKK